MPHPSGKICATAMSKQATQCAVGKSLKSAAQYQPNKNGWVFPKHHKLKRTHPDIVPHTLSTLQYMHCNCKRKTQIRPSAPTCSPCTFTKSHALNPSLFRKPYVMYAGCHTCVRCRPCHGRQLITMLHSSTPKANTSAALVSLPSNNSSGGMCVTVPKVCKGQSRRQNQ